MPLTAILQRACSGRSISGFINCMSVKSLKSRPWAEVKLSVEKVQKHVCGHVSYTDLKLLLQKNYFWSDTVYHYVTNIQQTFSA